MSDDDREPPAEPPAGIPESGPDAASEPAPVPSAPEPVAAPSGPEPAAAPGASGPAEPPAASDGPERVPVPEGETKPWERSSPRNRRLLAMLSMLGLAGAAFLTGLFLFNDLVMPRLVHTGNEQRIPDLTHLTLEQAEQQLSALGLQLTRAGERFDPSVPRGFVLTQDPPAETPIRGKKRVAVMVSLGEEFSSVPELFGESIRTAHDLLQRAGLRLGGITRAPSEEVGEDLVAATDPPAETVLGRDAPVSVLVSTGGGEESFVMPDVVGREIGGVRRQLEAFGFRVLTPPAAPSVGAVVYQDPPAGSHITRATKVTLQATGRMIR